ncbi:hypothetical protein [Pantoea cypripedii]|uniref:Uncharacterized protein n=1 Tax=Pantoea cypripedii TaxID=55209 RepID=A0A6B9G8B1_PANCY|nr:hypothetical protein [Pantoea cypripedii]QGY29049.1 hypothetical protein CUN67_08950 [Pantoea cypripedii]
MSELIVVTGSEVSTEKKQSGIRITDASDTSKAALKYADELQREFAELLYKPMAQADIKIAGRFHSLISELRFMVSMTAKNVEKGR